MTIAHSLWVGPHAYLIPPALAIGFYLLSMLALKAWLQRHSPWRAAWLLATSLAALALHAVLLHHHIDIGGVQNLSAANLGSLLCWTLGVALWCMAWRRYLWAWHGMVAPLAMLSIVWVSVSPGQSWVHAGADPAVLWHVLWGVLMVTVLTLAAMTALMMLWQERRIRGHSLFGVGQYLPALGLLEKHLFQWLWAGLALLTAMLVTSAYQYQWLLWSTPRWRFKLLAATLAWLLFASALVGRIVFGSRGTRVALATMAGVVLLWVVYVR